MRSNVRVVKTLSSINMMGSLRAAGQILPIKTDFQNLYNSALYDIRIDSPVSKIYVLGKNNEELHIPSTLLLFQGGD